MDFAAPIRPLGAAAGSEAAEGRGAGMRPLAVGVACILPLVLADGATGAGAAAGPRPLARAGAGTICGLLAGGAPRPLTAAPLPDVLAGAAPCRPLGRLVSAMCRPLNANAELKLKLVVPAQCE